MADQSQQQLKRNNQPKFELSEKTVEKLFEVQKSELEVRSKEVDVRLREIDLRGKESANAAELASKGIEAGLKDRAEARNTSRSMQRDRLVFFGVVALLVTGCIVAAIVYNKEAIAQEIIKALILIFGGGAGGYAIGRSSTTKDTSVTRESTGQASKRRPVLPPRDSETD